MLVHWRVSTTQRTLCGLSWGFPWLMVHHGITIIPTFWGSITLPTRGWKKNDLQKDIKQNDHHNANTAIPPSLYHIWWHPNNVFLVVKNITFSYGMKSHMCDDLGCVQWGGRMSHPILDCTEGLHPIEPPTQGCVKPTVACTLNGVYIMVKMG